MACEPETTITNQQLSDMKKNVDVFNEVVTSEQVKTPSAASDGESKDTLVGLNQKFGGINVGDYVNGTVLNEVWEYAYYSPTGTGYKIASKSDLPYTIDATTYPDPETLVGLGVLKRISTEFNSTKTQEELIDGQIYPESGALANGMTVTAGTTHLRVLVGGEPTIVAMSPIASGSVSLLDGDGATLGVTQVKFSATARTPTTLTILGLNLPLGSTIETYGFSAIGDGGHSKYRVSDSGTPDGWSCIALDNGTYANIIPENNEVNNLQAGIFADGITIYTTRMLELHEYGRDENVKIKYVRSPLYSSTIRTNAFVAARVNIEGDIVEPIVISLVYDGANPVLAQFKIKSKVKGMRFESEESDLNFQRCGFEQTSDVICEWCDFVGFRNPTNSNSWGVYIANANNIQLIDCGFDDNTQSDFAIVDNVENIQIIRPRALNGNLVANIEPNANDINKRILIDGARINTMYALLNTRTTNPIQSVQVSNCEIDLLVYDGADIAFVNSRISDIIPENNNIYMGAVDMVNTGLSFGDNRVTDSRLSVVSVTGNANWIQGFSTGLSNQSFALASNNSWRGLQINPSQASINVSVKSNVEIPVIAGELYAIALTGFAETLIGGFYGNYAFIRFLDGSDSLVERFDLRCFRSGDNATTSLRTEFGFVKAPVGAVKAEIRLQNGEDVTTNRVTFLSVSMHKVTIGFTNFDTVKNYHTLSARNVVVRNSNQYKQDLTYRIAMLEGDEVYVGTDKYICTDDTVINGDHWVGGWSIYDKTPA